MMPKRLNAAKAPSFVSVFGASPMWRFQITLPF
jgi:hypothetical protein